MFSRTGVLKICSEFKGEHPCSDFNKVALQRYLQVNIGLALRPHWVLEAMLFYANLSFKKLFHFFFLVFFIHSFFLSLFFQKHERKIHTLPSFFLRQHLQGKWKICYYVYRMDIFTAVCVNFFGFILNFR